MNETQQLLKQYVEDGSETAFRELVSRYLNLVHSTALRLVEGDAHLAKDIAQTVFVQLARNARKLAEKGVLGGWLHRTTCNTASNLLRAERRRLKRETEAMLMNSPASEDSAAFEQIAPVLDEAIDHLSEQDRAAIVLRFFEQRDFRSVGLALGSGEDAARMRVKRALEKLQGMLKKKGIGVSSATLASMLTASGVSAAPAGLGASITSAVLMTTGNAGASTIGILHVMSQTKAIVAGAVLVAGLTGTLVWQHQNVGRMRNENAALRMAATALQEEIDALKQRSHPPAAVSNLADQERTELLRLRGEMGLMRGQLAAARQENERLVAAARRPTEKPQTEADLAAQDEAKAARFANSAKRLGLALHIYRGQHNDAFPASFEKLSASSADILGAENYEQFELYPISGELEELDDASKTIVIRGGLFQMASGKWTMVYGMADGAVHRLSANTPDFREEERRLNLIYPPDPKTRQQ